MAGCQVGRSPSSRPTSSSVAWVIGARGALQFWRPKIVRCLMPPRHRHFCHPPDCQFVVRAWRSAPHATPPITSTEFQISRCDAATHLIRLLLFPVVAFVLVGASSSKSVSNRIGMKFDRNVLQVNVHQLAESWIFDMTSLFQNGGQEVDPFRQHSSVLSQ